MRDPLYPTLYQINTRVWLTELSKQLGRPATLDDVADSDSTGSPSWGLTGSGSWACGKPAGWPARLTDQPGMAKEFQETLPDLREKTSPVRVSRSPDTRCSRPGQGERFARGCESACASAACG
jgi:hypothetical protein